MRKISTLLGDNMSECLLEAEALLPRFLTPKSVKMVLTLAGGLSFHDMGPSVRLICAFFSQHGDQPLPQILI